MGDSNFTQGSFLGGEWSPLAQGRFDKPEYKTAMNVCRNSYPLEEGAWIRRSGSRFSNWTRGGALAKYIPFAFEEQFPYLMEFTDGYLRFVTVAAIPAVSSNLLNALPQDFRLVTENVYSYIVTSISTADPAVISIGGTSTWATGDEVILLFDNTVDPSFAGLFQSRQFAITAITSGTFSIVDAITGVAFNGAGLEAVSSLTGRMVVQKIIEIQTPYQTADLPNLRTIQSEKFNFILHGKYEPTVVIAQSLPTASLFAVFSYANNNFPGFIFQDGPYIDPPTDGTYLTPSGGTGSILTASSIASINGGAGFLSTDVGRLIRCFSQPADYNPATAYTVGETVTYNNVFFTCIQNGTGQQPDIAVAYWSITPSVAQWTWGAIDAINSTSQVSVTFTTGGGYLFYQTLPVTLWQLGLYSNTTGWPTCGLYYQGRLWLAGAAPNRIDTSVANAINGIQILSNGDIAPGTLPSFSPTATDGTVADSNGISYTFNSDDVNPIYWIKEVATGLLCGTLESEWLIPTNTQSPLTPTSFSASKVTTYGSDNIEPIHTEITTAFVQRYGRKLLECFQDVFSARVVAQNLAEFAKHLTSPRIAEIRYQQELLPIIWSRMNDGSLAGTTYRRDSLFSSQPAKFVGWHRHDLGSGAPVTGIAICPTQDGELDALAMTTEFNGYYQLEIMTDVFDVDETIQNGWFLDDAIVPCGGVISAILNFINNSSQILQFQNNSSQNEYFLGVGNNLCIFYGLNHLIGQTVSVTIGGVDCGNAIVSATGSIVVSIGGTANLVTSAYLASISSTTDRKSVV